MSTDRFDGFPQGVVTFLTELAANNNKPWFEAHRQDYEQNLLEPTRAFADTMADRLTEIAPPGLGEVRGSAFRIYRDVRFSKDKTPYKTHLGIAFNAAGSPKGESPGYYFHLDPPRIMLGAGMHAFPKAFLTAYREAVVDDRLGSRLRRAIDDAATAGQEIWGESYKRVPAGYDADHPRADLLRYGGLFVAVTEDIPDALHSADLVEYCASRYAAMGPVLAWLLELSAA
jgi:uncharacterized protein (TIGR02453 family)